jgi:DnaJ-class molecular chaperone
VARRFFTMCYPSPEQPSAGRVAERIAVGVMALAALCAVCGCRSVEMSDPYRKVKGVGMVTDAEAVAVDVETPTGWKIHVVGYGSKVNVEAVKSIAAAAVQALIALP